MTGPPPPPAAEAIKTMKLYGEVGERVARELKDRELDDPVMAAAAPLEAPALYALDCMHYLGEAAVRDCARACGLAEGSRVLEVGAGLGGPARLLAYEFGCETVALELQPDLSEAAAALTARCRLGHKVRHVAGDVLDLGRLDSVGAAPFDAAVSFLCFLHIEDKGALLEALKARLRPRGAVIYAEDFFQLRPFTAAEARSLKVDVYASRLPTEAEYRAALDAAGFRLDSWTDMTAEWAAFVADRRADYEAARDRHVRVHGAEAYEAMGHFYGAMDALFAAGGLGGVRFKATLLR